MNNQTIETLKKIAAKCTLGLPLTEHEKAMWTLYGDAYTNGITPAAPEKAQTVAERMNEIELEQLKAYNAEHGTLCECKFPDIGAPIPPVIEYVKRLRAAGNIIILWTCRTRPPTFRTEPTLCAAPTP